MDILDILLDILLKPPQPFIGLFFTEISSKSVSPPVEQVLDTVAEFWEVLYIQL